MKHGFQNGFRFDPRISCDGKDRLTSTQAREIAKRQRNGNCSPYHCEHCKTWHVGHVARKATLARKRPPRHFDAEE